MTVYARGYRPYEGAFSRVPGWWVIYREGVAAVFRRRAMRWMRLVFIFSLLIVAAVLYISVQQAELMSKRFGQVIEIREISSQALRGAVVGFYSLLNMMTAVACILAGAGLVADDLKTRALPLYLVRPIRPFDYALGKALVLPAVLVVPALVPGPLLLLLMGLWQPPGETAAFLADHVDVVRACVMYYLVAAVGYTGMMLFLSSQTPRRGVVISAAAAVVFGGTMVQLAGTHVRGAIGQVMRVVGLPGDVMLPILRFAFAGEPDFRRAERRLADPLGVALFVGVVLLFGFLSAWRRARTVEVAG